VIVCAGRSALAEEANVGAVGTVGATPAPAAAPAQVVSGGERFAAPNGQLGAGIWADPEQKARAFGELGFMRTGYSFFNNDVHITSLSFLVGGGYKITPNLELQAMLPFAWANFAGGDQSESGFAFGNLHLGVSYLHFGGPLRVMVGGALEYGPWTGGYAADSTLAVLLGHPAMGGEGLGLWFPEVFSIVAPARIEYAFPTIPALVLSGDVALGLHIPTGGGDTELTIQLSPGLGYYATDTVLVGMRLPFTVVPTESGGDATFFALQPYGRFEFGRAFLDASLVLNVDDPYGFAFDEGKYWALRLGGGGSF